MDRLNFTFKAAKAEGGPKQNYKSKTDKQTGRRVRVKVGKAHPDGNIFDRMKATQQGHARKASAAKGRKTRLMNQARAAGRRLGEQPAA